MVSNIVNATAIDAGVNHTCAVLVNGTVQCWGSSLQGQLGAGVLINGGFSKTPISVIGLNTATAVSAGNNHACALLTGGTMQCWGRNIDGQLGSGNNINTNLPVMVSGLNTAMTISAGGNHTCAILTDRTARCWGRNIEGQLGNGGTTNNNTPVMVSNINTAMAIAAGGDHTCGLLGVDTVQCWGLNTNGQLGNTTNTNSNTPTAIGTPPPTTTTTTTTTTPTTTSTTTTTTTLPPTSASSSARNISNSSGLSQHPEIAASGTTVIAAWEDFIAGNSKPNIFVARSTDSGATFGSPLTFSNGTSTPRNPKIAISGTTVLVVWEDNRGAGYDISMVRSTDGGATFSTTTVFSTFGNSFDPQVAIQGTTVLVSWEDISTLNYEVLIARSTDGGVTFASPLNLSNNSGGSVNPQIMTSGTTVIVAWEDSTPGNTEIFVSRSTNNGATFGPPLNISNTAVKSIDPKIAISGTTVLITWADGNFGSDEIFVSRSMDSGTTFAPPMNISNSGGGAHYPEIAISGAIVMVTWQDFKTGNDEIFLSRSTDSGASFASPLNLSNNTPSSFGPKVTALGTTGLIVVWRDRGAGNLDIFVARSTDSGATFGSPVNVSNSSGSASGLKITVLGTTVLAIWEENPSGNQEILITRF
jgi:hypothetical protein